MALPSGDYVHSLNNDNHPHSLNKNEVYPTSNNYSQSEEDVDLLLHYHPSNRLAQAKERCGVVLFRKINILLVTMLLLQTATMVLTKRISMHMANYPFTLTQMQPISTTTLFGLLTIIQVICLKWVIPERSKQIYTSVTSTGVSMFGLPPGWYNFSKLKLLFLGVLFSFANFLIFSGSRGELVSGPLSVLIQQVAVPLTFILSRILLRKRYNFLHYIGAGITLCGIFISLWPSLRVMDQKSDHAWAVLLIFGSAICTSGALTFIERFLKHDQMPFLYAWTWINVLEIIVTFPLLFAIIPIQGVPFNEMFENVHNGYRCLWRGFNYSHGDDCNDVGFWFLAFVIILVANKINMTYILRHGNVTLGMVAITCAVPLANVCFTSKRIMGKGGDVSLSPYDISGIVLVCSGLILYRIATVLVRPQWHNNYLGDK